MTLVAGVDSSTLRTTVEIRDLESGRLVGRGSAPHADTSRPDRVGCSEADPEDWWRALRAAMNAAIDAAGDGRIDAVGIAGQPHGMVALDDRRQVIRPAKLWNDTETAPDAGWLAKQLPDGVAGWVAACGSAPVAGLTIASLSWLHRSEPDAWNRLAHVLLPSDWLTFRLTGELVADRGSASGSGYWDASAAAGLGGYRFDLLAIVDRHRDWRDVVPMVLAPHERAGIVGPDTAALLHPALAGAVVPAGTGHDMAVALGGALAPGDVAVSVDQAVTVLTVSDAPVVDLSGTVANVADATGHHLSLVRSWPGAPTGVVPERIDRGTAGELAQRASDAFDVLRAHTPVDGRVLMVGDGAGSDAVCRLFAERCDRRVEVLDSNGTHEAAAAGAAVHAAAVLTGDLHGDIACRWGVGTGRSVTGA